MVSMKTTTARHHIYLHDPLAWTLARVPQHFLAQLSQLLLLSAVLCQQSGNKNQTLIYSLSSDDNPFNILFNQFLLAVFLPYQLLGFPSRLESLGQLVNLTKLSLSAVLSSHLESKSLYFMQYSHLESESLYKRQYNQQEKWGLLAIFFGSESFLAENPGIECWRTTLWGSRAEQQAYYL